jgi:hypothetical protein
MIRLYVSLLGRRDGMEAEGDTRLYDYPFRGVVEALPDDVTSLIVLPDGPPYRAPFGALVDGPTGRFLAERFDVAVVPSAVTFQAGARTVVASLWLVRDRATAALMNRFATHLGNGLDVTAALARARRDLVRRGAPPASRAGTAVLGDGDLVLVARSGAGSTVLLVAICIAAGLAVGTTLSSLGAGRRRSG